MSAIDKLKTLFQSKFSDGKSKISIYVNEQNVTEMNCIRIFYTGNTDWVSKTQHNSPYYKIELQITSRHIDYNKSRDICFDVLEYINANRKTEAGYYWIPTNTPTYLGVDNNGGYVYGFNLEIKGGA